MMQKFKIRAVIPGVCAACMILGYFGISECLWNYGYFELSEKVNPWQTEHNIYLMAGETDDTKVSLLAEQILKQNQYVFLAYEAEALHCAGEGNWAEAISNQKLAAEHDRYSLKRYETLLAYLQKGAVEALSLENMELAKEYVEEMKQIPGQLEEIERSTSWLGRKIAEQPELELDKEVLTYIESL